MSTIQEVPSLHIYRQVTNISEGQIQDIRTHVRQELGLSQRKVSFNTDLKANVLAPGQLISFFTALGEIATHDEVNGLADHLANRLPDSFDEAASAVTLPLQCNFYKNSRKQHSISLAADNSIIATETASMARLAYDFCDASKVIAFEDAWPPRPHFNQVHIVRSYSREILEDVRHFLTETNLLPSVVELEQGSIEDVTFTAHYSNDFMLAWASRQ